MASASVVTVNNTSPVTLATGLGNITLYCYTEIRIGGSGVDWETGFPVPAGVIFPIPIGLAISEHIYAITNNSDTDVRVLKTSVV